MYPSQADQARALRERIVGRYPSQADQARALRRRLATPALRRLRRLVHLATAA